ncbi:MAG: DUF2530 domain-containing protein [Actinobacteria bacterium]|nr:MAG: DUF2530 domain-containing protein [Actinomycetota bacterium]
MKREMPPLILRESPIVLTGTLLWVAGAIITAFMSEETAFKACVVGALLGCYGTYRTRQNDRRREASKS